ncbi:hypothetical protein [Sphingobacterium sp. IITKGP-BTPF85]|nr:hypothetical protein [Sphingobacterium sp. IITKGP-BTPF85]KKX46555.1 hypothetical protein L950_0231290 [Sphingobacterium sp. IITKGP-BTPF85]
MNYLFDISPINTALFALAMPLLAFLYQAVVGKKINLALLVQLRLF